MKKSILFPFLLAASTAHSASFLVEAEHFADKGGWGVDTQFIESMGSPYLIAHGLGKPVTDAKTTAKAPEAGEYRVWVRTINWTKRLDRPAAAGTFRLIVNGKATANELGGGDAVWSWQLAGNVTLQAGDFSLGLRDLTGFDGRADAVLFSNERNFSPPADATFEERTKWKIAGVPSAEVDAGQYDLVVVGGGYGGLGSAISAARMGAKVALIQNRKVLGGNGSSEIRVWAMGDYPASEYPLHEVIQEFEDKAKASPGPAEEFVDDKKAKVVAAEKNITLFLGHHAYGLKMDAGKIAAVRAVDVEAGKLIAVKGKFFVDCTGHGFLGLWSGADTSMADKGRMGMSNMWMWNNTPAAVTFAEQPWMHKFTTDDFPYPTIRHGSGHAEWFWESGFDAHPLHDLEQTRDLNLLAAYSAWNGIKNHGAHAARDPKGHANAEMTWLAYVGGTRETLQILGDVIVTGEDVVSKRAFDDGTFKCTWSIDLHYPLKKYENAIPGKPFISRAEHGKGVDRKVGYAVPYRALYSRNIPNLFTAGRNISVERHALGTIRVMKTIGMMGVTVGRAAALAVVRDCGPREIYTKHLADVKTLWKMSGNTRFENLDALKASFNGKSENTKAGK